MANFVVLDRLAGTASSGNNFVINPWPIVLPESLKANLNPSEINTGKWNLILTVRLSPGIPTLTLSGSFISVATSQVLK